MAAVEPQIAVIGAGYVGLPLAAELAEAGRPVVLVDVDADRVARINLGQSYIADVPSERLRALVERGAVRATTSAGAVVACEDIVICVPTPLTRNREPDLSYIEAAAEAMAPHLRRGHLVVLESTTYPGTTRDQLRPILERISGLRAGIDFNLAMAPERIDPGNRTHTIRTVPKVVGGLTAACTERAMALYAPAIDSLVAVSTPEAAELTKLLENIFRSVNIAFMNEMAMLCDRLGIDVWEVVDAAATKPFGFMSFQPGPGLGGHCLPLDPFYLAWKAREVDFHTEFIELAGKVNENMPYFCLQKVARALNGQSKSVRGSRILVLGVAYKSDVDDLRESPALKLIQLLQAEGAEIAYHDRYVAELDGIPAVELSEAELAGADCVAIVTAHSGVDYDRIVELAPVVVDFRNATGRNGTLANGKVVKL
jgi:UDP-N-acetyl-D-glucosamine dehydrogenase